jgi:hypothetical protein
MTRTRAKTFDKHLMETVIYSFMFKTLQLQRFIKCLIITRYDLKCIGICPQLIVAAWLVLNNLFENFLYDICKVYPLDD